MSAAAKQVLKSCLGALLQLAVHSCGEAWGANTAHVKQSFVGAFTFSSCRGKAGIPSTAEVLASLSL
jgi:hypothetical protein